MDFTCVIFQLPGDGAYPPGIDDPNDAIDFYIAPIIKRFVLCVDLKVGVDLMSSP